MAIPSASYQFSAAYGGVTVRKKPAAGKETEQMVKAAIASGSAKKLDLKVSEYDWYSAWGVKEAETVNDDGTITKSLSGGSQFFMAGLDENGNTVSGKRNFSVSLTFDPASYEGGQLGATADLLAAAHEAAEQAARSGGMKRTGLEAVDEEKPGENYRSQKETVAKSFADMVGIPLEERGHAGEWDKIYKSVHAVFASFEAKYEAVTASVDKESWMDDDLIAAAMKLRKAGMSFQASTEKVRGLYTLRELEFAAIGLRTAGMSLNA